MGAVEVDGDNEFVILRLSTNSTLAALSRLGLASFAPSLHRVGLSEAVQVPHALDPKC